MKRPSDQEIIERAERKFPDCKAYWEKHHARFSKIVKFVKSQGEFGQWDEQTYRARGACNPPRLTLTENLLGPFVLQVANDLKQSEFGALVKPKDSDTDPKLAKVRQGLHRGIQQIGDFRGALDPAIEDLVNGGLGAWRLITKYQDPMSFQKEIEYLSVDPTRLFHGDGTNRKRNFSDVTDSFIYEPYSEERFKAEFDKDPKDFLNASKLNPIWGNGKSPWVTEYFFITEESDTLVMFGKKEMLLSEFREKMKNQAKEMGLKVEDLIAQDKDGKPITRETTRRQVWWAKLAGREVLKVEAWPGYCIPNFLVTGRKCLIDGEQNYYGLAEPARDVQTAHNYAFSAMVERAGLAPKVRIFAALESIPPQFRGTWDNLNTSDKMVAYYSAFTEDGKPLPAPRQEPPIQSDPAFINLRQMTIQGIKDTLGMWESSLGAQSQERSGIAIQTRERQSDTGNYDWGANLAIGAEHCFKVTDELINKVIDVPTQIRIVGEDLKDEVIWAASLDEDDPNEDGYFNLNQGKFDLICKMAAGTDTARDEQSRGMEMLFQGDPDMKTVMAPEYIELQPWRNADKMSKIAASYRAMKMPGISNGEEKDGAQDAIPPQIKQQMQQMQQQMAQMGEALKKLGPENQQLKIENQSIKADKGIDAKRLEIEQFKADTDRLKVQAEYDLKNKNLLLANDRLTHDVGFDGVAQELAHRKMHMDQMMKPDAMASMPTGAEPGNSPTDSDISGSTMEG